MKLVIARMSVKERESLARTPAGRMEDLKYTLGVEIRNQYGLWRGNEKLTVAACGQPCHPDDASMEIIRATWRALQPK